MTNDLKRGVIILLVILIGFPLIAILGEKMGDFSGYNCRQATERYKLEETKSKVLGKETEGLRHYRDLIQEKCR
jgi:hypothetical protein